MSHNCFEIRKHALLKAEGIIGSEILLAKRLNVHPSTLNKCKNDPTRKMPYHIALAIEQITGISVHLLVPDKPKINDYVNQKRTVQEQIFTHVLKDAIRVNPIFARSLYDDRPVIVDKDGALISGLVAFERQRLEPNPMCLAIVLDMEALWLETKRLRDIPFTFLRSEFLSIGLHFERLIGNRQGRRTDLIRTRVSGEQNSTTPLLPADPIRSIWSEVSGRKDVHIAKIIEFKGHGTYTRAKSVFLKGIPELIRALDAKILSISKAAQISTLSKTAQHQQFHPLGATQAHAETMRIQTASNSLLEPLEGVKR